MKLFFCHSSNDKPFVRELIATLPASIRSWLDEREMHVGQPIRDVLRRGVESSDLVVAVLSRDSIDSDWVNYELKLAIERERLTERGLVLPIVIDSVAAAGLPAHLEERRYLRLADRSRVQVEVLSRELCKGIAAWMVGQDPMLSVLEGFPAVFAEAAVQVGRIAATIDRALRERLPEVIRAVYLDEYGGIQGEHVPPPWLVGCAVVAAEDLRTSAVGESAPGLAATTFVERHKPLVQQCFFLGYYAMSLRRPLAGISVDEKADYDVGRLCTLHEELVSEMRSGTSPGLTEIDEEVWNLGLAWIRVICGAMVQTGVLPADFCPESTLMGALFRGVTIARSVERLANAR